MSVVDQLRLFRVTRENSGGLEEMGREFQAAGEPGFELALEDPRAFLDRIELFALGNDLPPDRVQQSEFWLIRASFLALVYLAL